MCMYVIRVTRPSEIYTEITRKRYETLWHRLSYNGKQVGNRTRPMEWHQYQWPWVTLKYTFAVWNLSNSHTACTNYSNVYTWMGEHLWLVISTVLSKLKNFSRSQPVTCTVNVETSGTRCKIEESDAASKR